MIDHNLLMVPHIENLKTGMHLVARHGSLAQSHLHLAVGVGWPDYSTKIQRQNRFLH